MKGDFSRIRFEAANRFSRVLMQQGRVTLDADTNEQTEILLHYVRTLAHDLIGDFGGPIEDGGFTLAVVDGDLSIGAGRYYVHGILCECDGCPYSDQPDYKAPDDTGGEGGDALLAFLKSTSQSDERFFVYLDVWERHVTFVEDPRLREVALGGPDTCTRTRVTWQVRARTLEDILAALNDRLKALQKQIEAAGDDAARVAVLTARSQRVKDAIAALEGDAPEEHCAAPLEAWPDVEGAGMTARLQKAVQSKTPCIISPDARYRGAENQLYRVEIHHGGTADQATFKWSRDNGSVMTAWLSEDGNELHVAEGRGFCANAWVELSDDATDLRGEPGVLVRLKKVHDDVLTIDDADVGKFAFAPDRHPKVRCWDETGDGLSNGIPLLVQGASAWITLEDGIQVEFAADGEYVSGDYWLIPARVANGANGGIDWADGAQVAPRRAHHHYAPLGFVGWSTANGDAAIEATSCVCTLRPLTPCQAAVRTRLAAPPVPRAAGGDKAPVRTKGKAKKKPKHK